ncbi:hypothetical protein CAPTEDRAFT_212852 [Capitella teleta]|uniref:Uncharacterized protein n=1 Tax=Capitella teleta TaxID=283909 RepID=R7V4F1_CAPTE|nr:hypothetical protein CAPTEDRAFT_212852 [Capitella teleta]|eukprot:ELU11226.1 hypothetical protein CAPTEDRAFT_212852 [Capitella teleta]
MVAQKMDAWLKKMEKTIEQQGRVITQLTRRLEEAEAKINDTEQYSRLRIAVIPEETGEDASGKVAEVFRAMQLSPVINRTKKKKKVMTKKKDIRASHSNIYIYEDLIKGRETMLYMARQMKRFNHIKDAWSVDGRIGIKDNDDRIKYLTKISDLREFHHK